jgi:hypothetical protein
MYQGHLPKAERALAADAAATVIGGAFGTSTVTSYIESVTGVHYHAGHVWRVMKDLGWSLHRPPVRRTWAPRGRTPLVHHPFRWKVLDRLKYCSALYCQRCVNNHELCLCG